MPKFHDWIKIDLRKIPPELLCKRCKARQVIPLPMPITMFFDFAKSFDKIHKHCEKQEKE